MTPPELDFPDHPTLSDAIVSTAARYPAHGFTFQGLDGRESFCSFARVALETERRAAALSRAGLRQGDAMALVVSDPEAFVLCFLAAVRLGVAPVALHPPLFVADLARYLENAVAVLSTAGARVAVVSDDARTAFEVIEQRVPALERLLTPEALERAEGPVALPSIAPDDLAFIQYTSGATGPPKGVHVSHRALIANIQAASGGVLQMHPDRDCGVSWLPLYHDMGLIGFCLSPVYTGVNQVIISPLRFLQNVSVWIDALHRHRATVSFGTNFAFSLAIKRARRARLEQWDLSHIKSLGCAAEPIHLPTLREFARVFARSKLREEALAPAYGLAEATLAVSMKRLGTPLRTSRVDAAHFELDGVIREPGDARVLEHVACGEPLAGHEIAIGDPNAPCPDEVEGEILVRGPSVAGACQTLTNEASALDRDGWLHTGDLGYLRDGQLYVTGRLTDILQFGRRRLHAHVVEWTVGAIPGLREGHVSVFSRAGSGGEELVVVAEAPGAVIASLRQEIVDAIDSAHQLRPADIVFVAAGRLPRTSSGKLQRQKVKRQYLQGTLGCIAPSQEWPS